MITRILLALLGVFVLAAMPSQAGSEQENLAAAAKQLGSYTDGFYLDHKPGAEAALDDSGKRRSAGWLPISTHIQAPQHRLSKRKHP